MSKSGNVSHRNKSKKDYREKPGLREKHLAAVKEHYELNRDEILEKKKERYHRRMSILLASQPGWDDGCNTRNGGCIF